MIHNPYLFLCFSWSSDDPVVLVSLLRSWNRTCNDDWEFLLLAEREQRERNFPRPSHRNLVQEKGRMRSKIASFLFCLYTDEMSSWRDSTLRSWSYKFMLRCLLTPPGPYELKGSAFTIVYIVLVFILTAWYINQTI